jgi:hypothetical protein
MKKKTYLSLLLSICLVVLSLPASAQSLVFKSHQIHTVDGEVLVPLRQVAQFAGYTVHYTPGEVTLTRVGRKIQLNHREGTLVANGHHHFLATEPCVVEGVLYVPLSMLEDHLRLAAKLEQGSVTVNSIAENKITIINQKETFEDKHLTVQLQYPRILGLQQVGVQINSLIAEKVASIREAAHKDEEELLANLWKPDAQIDYYLNYLVKRNHSDLLSIVFEDYRYLGGAHGQTDKFAYNFDLRSGKQYSLGDLFSQGVDYVSVINKEIETLISQDPHKSQVYSFDSIAPDQVFYLSNDALVICFQSYEIACYAEGRPEFAIPLSKLKKVLSPALKEALEALKEGNRDSVNRFLKYIQTF